LILADFAEQAGIVVLPLLLVAGLLALVVSGLVAFVPPENLVTRLGHAGLAVILAVASAWLALYASGEDTYYSGGVSRWEHAGRGEGTWPVGLAMIIGALTILGLAASALDPRRRWLRLGAAPAAVLSCGVLLFGWLLLTWGH
jgi:hypothetical protein